LKELQAFPVYTISCASQLSEKGKEASYAKRLGSAWSDAGIKRFNEMYKMVGEDRQNMERILT
jgi:hypothetical protein